jgi:hypothetical protein
VTIYAPGEPIASKRTGEYRATVVHQSGAMVEFVGPGGIVRRLPFTAVQSSVRPRSSVAQ